MPGAYGTELDIEYGMGEGEMGAARAQWNQINRSSD